MKRWLAIGSLILGGGIAGAAPSGSKASLELPSGAKLVGTTQVDAVRAFPEMNKKQNTSTEDVVATGAVDRTYETKQGYKDAVGYFDSMVKNGSATQLSRTITRTATGWELKLSDGTMQNVIVRNTQPTTIETTQSASAFERDTFHSDAAARPNSDAEPTTKMNRDSAAQDSSMPSNQAAIKTKANDNR